MKIKIIILNGLLFFIASQNFAMDKNQTAQTDKSQSCALSVNMLGLGFLTALVGKIAYDISWQAQSAQSITELYNNFTFYLKSNNIQSLTNPELYKFFTQERLEFIAVYEDWMRNSYNSYVKPWNWTPKQKVAYEKIQLLSMIALHGPMVLLQKSVTSDNIVAQARRYCFVLSKYPLLAYNNILTAHIAALSDPLSFCIPQQLTTFISEIKNNIRNFQMLLYSDKEYAHEIYNYKIDHLPIFKEYSQY